MNSLVKIGIGIFASIVLVSMFSECGRKERQRVSPSTQSTPAASEVTVTEKEKGLDLKAVTELAKKAKDAADFERLLNLKDEGVNNIDLDKDGKVDYIKVTEYGSGDRKGFSLTTEPSPGDVQEIATIEFKKEGDKAIVQTTGSPSLYGPGSYHHSSFGLTDMLLLGWLFSNRPSYSSPYGYGNYPPSYGGGWNRQDDRSYTGSMTSRTAGSTIRSSSSPVIPRTIASPNADRISEKARALTTPGQSQRSFAPSSRPSSTGSSGYGSSSSSSPPSATRSGGFGRSSSSSSSRSGGSFGGGK